MVVIVEDEGVGMIVVDEEGEMVAEGDPPRVRGRARLHAGAAAIVWMSIGVMFVSNPRRPLVPVRDWASSRSRAKRSRNAGKVSGKIRLCHQMCAFICLGRTSSADLILPF